MEFNISPQGTSNKNLLFGDRPIQRFNFKWDGKSRGFSEASGLSLLKGSSVSERLRGRGQQRSKGAEGTDNDTSEEHLKVSSSLVSH